MDHDTRSGLTSDVELYEAGLDDPLILVSCDGHVGPTLEQMRPYCPSEYLEQYDELIANRVAWDVWAPLRPILAEMSDRERADRINAEYDRNWQTAGHTDVHARLADMDAEGIAAECVYHSSQNGEPVPFIMGGSAFFDPLTGDTARAKVGIHIFNQWLADMCATAPDRLIGMIHIAAWDPEAAYAEVEWGAQHGLRAINFPTSRPGVVDADDPVWERFWSLCEDYDLTLNTHVGGAGGPIHYPGPGAMALSSVDRSGWLCRRHLPRMIFSGVLERHPRLKIVLTEQTGEWWATTMREYDLAWDELRWAHSDVVPRPPSEYCAEQVWIGGSYLSKSEAEFSVRDGYVPNLMWGSDYPHAEGTYQYPQSPDDPSFTHLALRHAFSGLAAHDAKLITSDNGLRCFSLRVDALAPIARRINSPTLRELATPLDEIPQGLVSRAFRP